MKVQSSKNTHSEGHVSVKYKKNITSIGKRPRTRTFVHLEDKSKNEQDNMNWSTTFITKVYNQASTSEIIENNYSIKQFSTMGQLQALGS